MLEGKTVLIVDDDTFFHASLLGSLYTEGALVINAQTLADGQTKLREAEKVDLVILDIRLPLGDQPEDFETEISRNTAKGGFESGLVLAQWIKRNYPEVPVIGCSVHDPSDEVAQWFVRNGAGYLQKSISSSISMLDFVRAILTGDRPRPALKSFIVHGSDEQTKLALKNYLQNVLNLPEPIILHEQASQGRAIIEKFEEIARNVDVAFVLLTPDDHVYDPHASSSITRRARQNVIFELGYFLASLQRKRGKVLLLYKGELELPSDIAGLVYIDISAGIESAGEKIRRELFRFLT